jgi:hypothetical protein
MISLVFSLFMSSIFAQDYQADPYTMEGQGNLITLRFVMGDKSGKIFVVGKEAAKLNFDKDTKILNITAFRSDGVKEELRFEPGVGYYTVKNLPEWKDPYELKVSTKEKKGEEEVNIKMKAKP